MGGDRRRNEKTPALVRTGLWRTRYGALTLRKKEADQVAHTWDATQTRRSAQRLVTKSVLANCGHGLIEGRWAVSVAVYGGQAGKFCIKQCRLDLSNNAAPVITKTLAWVGLFG
jgi:hypothetical protein